MCARKVVDKKTAEERLGHAVMKRNRRWGGKSKWSWSVRTGGEKR